MTMKASWMLFLLVLASCNGSQGLQSNSSHSQRASRIKFQDRAEFVDLFNRDHRIHKKSYIDLDSLNISVVKKLPGNSPNAIGACNNSTGDIYLLDSYWRNATYSQRKSLIYHEMGHCILKRNHLSRKINGIAVSMMYPNSEFDHFYPRYREEYVKELFTKNSDDIEDVLNGERSVVPNNTNEMEDVIFCSTNDFHP